MKPVPWIIPYGHSLWWLCRLRGELIRPNLSWSWYYILLSIRNVLTIIHVYYFSTRTFQIRRRTPPPPISLRLRQEIDGRKRPPMDPLKRFKNNRRSRWMPIFGCIIRTYMAYYNPNEERIRRIEASRTRILVPRGTPCRNDAKPSPWPIRPETHHVIWTCPQRQTWLQDMVWIILYRILQPWHRQLWESFPILSTYTRWHRSR